MSRYGNEERVRIDVTIINRIILDQGVNLLIDCIAEHIGTCALKFNLSEEESLLLMNKTMIELKEQILERI